MANRILLFTGDGKGKTTAALGMALRAAGHNMRVAIFQFVKGDAAIGELAAFNGFPNVSFTQHGLGFVPEQPGPQREEHLHAARAGLRSAAEALACGRYDLVVLDEICVALSKGLLTESDVLDAIRHAAGETVIVLTGRSAPSSLIALADTVTEMHCIKHGYAAGLPAQRGVEF